MSKTPSPSCYVASRYETPSTPLNSEDMKKYKSGKEEVPPYFLEFLDVL